MIRVRVVDPAALAARTPGELSLYLRSTGWQMVESNGLAAHWTKPITGHGEFEIMQPRDQASRDYSARVADAVSTLAIVEGRSELEILRGIAEVSELRAHVPEEDVVVTGEVVRLHREGNGTGEITLVGRVDEDDTLRRIWVELPAPDYDQAVRAHREMREVTVTGNLVRRGNRYVLNHPFGFRINGA